MEKKVLYFLLACIALPFAIFSVCLLVDLFFVLF